MALWITVKVNSLRSHYSHFSCICWDLLCRKALTLTLCTVRMRQRWGHLRCFPRNLCFLSLTAPLRIRKLHGSPQQWRLKGESGKRKWWVEGTKTPRCLPVSRKLASSPGSGEDEVRNRLLGCSHSHRRSPVRSPFGGEQWEVNARTHCPLLVTTLAATFPASREAFADRGFHPEAHHHLHEWKWVQTDCRDVC